tara:strand:- start:1335 stop:1898 length:564 start_codon:yes stop_codon:yes gene_type:complete
MVFDSGYSELPRSITPKFDIPDIPTADSILNASNVAQQFTKHPLCDKNLLKDIDGVMSMSTMPSLPNVEDILSASGLASIPEKLDPEAMFSGIPTLTKLPEMLGIPNIDEIDWEKEAMAAADDVLNQLNISNPLDDLCAQIQGAGADAQDLLGKVPDLSPNINAQMPNIDVPKFTDIVDIPEVGDIF